MVVPLPVIVPHSSALSLPPCLPPSDAATATTGAGAHEHALRLLGTGDSDEKQQQQQQRLTRAALGGSGGGGAVAVLSAALEAFRPDLVMISAGLDGRKGDPCGRGDLVAEDFEWLTLEVRACERKERRVYCCKRNNPGSTIG